MILTSPGKNIGACLFALQQAARDEDPTRLVMHEGDADLRINQSANSTRQVRSETLTPEESWITLPGPYQRIGEHYDQIVDLA